MPFNFNAYQQSVNVDQDIREAESEAQAQAAEKQAKMEEFKFDETEKFKKKAKEAQGIFGQMKGLGSIVGLVGASMLGLGPVAAGLMSAAGTAVGGKVGYDKAKGKLGGRFFKGGQEDLLDMMEGSVYSDALMTGIMGGIGGAANNPLAEGATRGLDNFAAGSKGFKGLKNFSSGIAGQGGKIMGGKTLFDSLGLTSNNQNWSMQ